MVLDDCESSATLDEISIELVRGLPDELSSALDRTWTTAVTHRLNVMGTGRNLFVCGHGCKDQGEWLLDVIWMTGPDCKVVLAVESEWGKLPAIQDDFGKLLSIKACRKLLLFSTKNHDGADQIVRGIEKMMLAYPYHMAGEEYMALEVTEPGAFRYRFEVPHERPLGFSGS